MVDIGHRDALPLLDRGEHPSPGIHNHRMAKSFAAGVVHAPLIGGQHVALVLDGSSPQQDFPMGSPGNLSEGRRNREDICPLLQDRKSTRLNSSHVKISYAVFCLKKKNK